MKKKYISLAAVLLLVLLSAVCLIRVVRGNNQASMPVPKEYIFSGEYSYDGVNWYPYDEESEMSALEGDMVVKGHLDSDILEGGILNFFCNHIGVSIYVNGELLYMDTPAEIRNYGIDLMASMCGKRWEQMMCPEITTEDEIEFRFINDHKHGNKEAYKEVLTSLMVTPPDITILEAYLKPYIRPFELTGYVLLIIAVMMLGAALSAVVFKSDMADRLFKMGMATLFAGGYVNFDGMLIDFLEGILVARTYGRQLCLMLAVYFLGWILSDQLTAGRKKVADGLMTVFTIVNLIILIAVTVGKVLLYDTQIYWELAQCVVSPMLMILCLWEIKKEKENRVKLLGYVLIHVAILLDMAGVGYHRYYTGICFKVSYACMLLVFLLYGTRQVVMDYHASVKNKKLSQELEQSRISVMLSQIQPHFLYNSLTSVMDLCDRDPKQAKAAIADFADYLRGNLSSLKTEKLISFRMELAHIEKYLRLEKLRFQEELEVIYDIQTQDFMLPALSVQPLVENAVKHGVGQKIGGGTVTIHTSETEEDYLIRITDDGVGFVEGEYAEDGGTHIGIENIKKRLDVMAKARLEIESRKGEGTTACIRIPKRSE